MNHKLVEFYFLPGTNNNPARDFNEERACVMFEG